MNLMNCEACGITNGYDLILPESPVPHLLNSNDYPRDEDAESIRKVLHQVDSDLKPLISEIDRLKAIVADLEAARETLVNFAREHRAVLSPTRRLPSEILQAIFLHCLPDRHSEDSFDIWDVKQAPWVLTQVCRRWRSIGMGYTRLWEHVVLHATSLKRPIRGRIQLLQTHIDRAVELPLRVRLHSEYDRKEDRDLVDVLVLHSLRWQSLELNVPVTLFKRLRSIRDRLPRLQKLKVYVQNYHAEDLSYMFGNTPALQEVKLVVIPFYDVYPTFPYRQLLRFAGGYNIALALSVLQQSENLVDCKLSVYERENYIRMPASSFRMSSLRTLDLRVERSYNILTYLDLPVLEEFCLEHIERPRGVDTHEGPLRPTPLLQMVQRSSPPLRELLIQGSFWSQDEFMSLLRTIPSVRKLQLSVIQHMVDFSTLIYDTDAMTGDFDALSSPLVPHLMDLSFEVHSQLNVDGLLDMIESRYRIVRPSNPSPSPHHDLPPAQLQSCHVRTAASFQPSIMTIVRLEKLRAEGMDVSITDQRYS
ncbi:hypothetical protein AAF712_006065 [Marasmius tenuissimus]|uniref:F-box domain-containing protein n=1 Tax=Marasmius tenuissimus TaxID=585030 RepID=A0ABR2ZYU8_9AGAR|nr:hypothetical protein PM082_007922 [Marasmius tenuissimus]